MEYLLLGVICNFAAVAVLIIIHIIYLINLSAMERYTLLSILQTMKETEYTTSGVKVLFPVVSLFIPFYKVYINAINCWYLFRATNTLGTCKEAIIYSIRKTEEFSIVDLRK